MYLLLKPLIHFSCNRITNMYIQLFCVICNTYSIRQVIKSITTSGNLSNLTAIEYCTSLILDFIH